MGIEISVNNNYAILNAQRRSNLSLHKVVSFRHIECVVLIQLVMCIRKLIVKSRLSRTIEFCPKLPFGGSRIIFMDEKFNAGLNIKEYFHAGVYKNYGSFPPQGNHYRAPGGALIDKGDFSVKIRLRQIETYRDFLLVSVLIFSWAESDILQLFLPRGEWGEPFPLY